MKRGLAVIATVMAVAYFSYVRDSEARCLRQRPAATCCQPVVCSAPCAVAWAVAAPPATKPPRIAPPKPKPRPASKLYGLLLIDDANPDTGAANKAGGALVNKMLTTGLPTARVGTIVTVTGSDITPDRIRQALDALTLTPDDTLICYY